MTDPAVELARKIRGCFYCGAGEFMPPDGCRRCHGLGASPEAVEAVREFERAVVERCAATIEALRQQVHKLEIRRREGRALLHRLVKYIVEDDPYTPGSTRLARLSDQVVDYLRRTADPKDILR